MAQIPIHNPAVPFLGLIPGGFTAGSKLRIRAEIQGFGNRCQINIQTGAALSPRSDVVLQLSVRPQENQIVRNHMKNQNWGAEERHGSPIHLSSHQSFEISIEAEHSFFKIFFNGKFFSSFNSRLPLSDAKFVSISGTCTVAYILHDKHGFISSPLQFPSFDIPRVNPPPPPPPVFRPPHFRPPPPPYYPGHYPGHDHPVPYGLREELKYKINHLKHHEGEGSKY